MICSKHVDSAAQFVCVVRGELSWRSCGCIRVPVPRNAQKLQSKQTNTSPTPKPMFSNLSLFLPLSCSRPEFMLICTCLCPVSGTCGRACPGERARTCFAVCFWQDKHKAQDEDRGREGEGERESNV